MKKERFRRDEIPLYDLKLDVENPRMSLFKPSDEAACIETLVKHKRKQMLRLVRDIAQHGLLPEPILLYKKGDKWIVKDGNRRIAALKLLDNPHIQSDSIIAARINEYKEKYNYVTPRTISCVWTSNLEDIALYIERKHLGALDGEGHLDWDSLEKAIYDFEQGKGKLGIKLIMNYCRNNNIAIKPDFPVTTLDRLLSKERLRRIGIANIDIDPAELVDSADPDEVRQVVARIISDIQEGIVNVKRTGSGISIYKKEDADKYITRIIKDPHAKLIAKPHARRGSTIESEKTSSTDIRRTPQRSNPYNRTKLIQRKEEIQIPASLPKAAKIQDELLRLKVKDYPVAVALLLRALFESAIYYYANCNGLGSHSTRQMIIQVAKHMYDNGILDKYSKPKDRLKEIQKLAANDEVFSIDTLHSFVHSQHDLPDYQRLVSIWVKVNEFLNDCFSDCV